MTKTTHTLSNGQELWLCTFTGEVLEQRRTSTLAVTQQAATVISTSMVIPGQVEAKTQSEHEIWLRAADGRERAVHMSDIGLLVRPGHTITVLWGSTAGNEDGQYFAGRNHTTEEVRSDVLALGRELRSWHLSVGAGASFLWWVVATALVVGLLGFVLTSGSLENRFSLALGGLIVGAVLGFAAWSLVGSSLGPERRARAITVSVSAWHLEPRRVTLDHRVHGERGGSDLGLARALAVDRCLDCLHGPADGRVLGAAPLFHLVDVSRLAASDGAAVRRSGCSVAWAAA
jgi:hypothetical protein